MRSNPLISKHSIICRIISLEMITSNMFNVLQSQTNCPLSCFQVDRPNLRQPFRCYSFRSSSHSRNFLVKTIKTVDYVFQTTTVNGYVPGLYLQSQVINFFRLYYTCCTDRHLELRDGCLSF